MNVSVQPDEVQTPDMVEFPIANTGENTASSSSSSPVPAGLAAAGVVLGVIGTVLGVIALVHRRSS